MPSLAHIDINTLALVMVGIVLAYNQWRQGTSRISSETIEAYKSQVEIYEKRLGAQTEATNSQAAQIGELKGMIIAKDKQIDEMRKIIENRNPELEQVLKQLTTFMRSVDERLTEVREHQMKPLTITTETTAVK